MVDDEEMDEAFEDGDDEDASAEKKKSSVQLTGTETQGFRATRSKDAAIQTLRQFEVINALRITSDMDEATRNATILDALDALCAIEPRDDFERMLGTQMVACHHAAMECFRRAMIPGQNFASRDMSLKHAEKLMSTYARHLETLNKHRGKGQQKVTVEHVHVEAGGQAIVGNVESGAKTRKSSGPVVIEHAPERPMEILKPNKKKRLSKRGKANGGNT